MKRLINKIYDWTKIRLNNSIQLFTKGVLKEGVSLRLNGINQIRKRCLCCKLLINNNLYKNLLVFFLLLTNIRQNRVNGLWRAAKNGMNLFDLDWTLMSLEIGNQTHKRSILRLFA